MKWFGISLVLYNKQNITCLLVDTNFIFDCSKRYQDEHEDITRAGMQYLLYPKKVAIPT